MTIIVRALAAAAMLAVAALPAAHAPAHSPLVCVSGEPDDQLCHLLIRLQR